MRPTPDSPRERDDKADALAAEKVEAAEELAAEAVETAEVLAAEVVDLSEVLRLEREATARVVEERLDRRLRRMERVNLVYYLGTLVTVSLVLVWQG